MNILIVTTVAHESKSKSKESNLKGFFSGKELTQKLQSHTNEFWGATAEVISYINDGAPLKDKSQCNNTIATADYFFIFKDGERTPAPKEEWGKGYNEFLSALEKSSNNKWDLIISFNTVEKGEIGLASFINNHPDKGWKIEKTFKDSNGKIDISELTHMNVKYRIVDCFNPAQKGKWSQENLEFLHDIIHTLK